MIYPVGPQHHSFDLYRGKESKSAAEKAEDDKAEEAAKAKKAKGK